ncbi:MAG TPA: ABC transporter permease [Candidatus Polarisedimenticolaceae bacterium]
MFRALFLKEWRQLRTLRWGGIVLTLVLPIAFLIGAEAASRGWAFGTLRSYSTKTLWGEALPATLALAVWPLFTALQAAHAWCAERQDGTGSFLLARPVRPEVLWRAKLAAVVLSSGAVVGAGTLMGAGLANTVVPWSKLLELIRWAGTSWLLLGSTLAVVLAAASFVTSTLFAALLGVVFGVGVGFAGFWTGTFLPFATLTVAERSVNAAWATVLFVPACLLVSWRAFTAGEPAGRARAARAGTVLGVATAAIAGVLVTTAWGMVRWNSAAVPRTAWVEAPSRGSSFLTSSPGWNLVDARTGAVLRRFVPPATSAAWNAEGSVAVIESKAGPLGSVRSRPRLLFVRSDGSEATAPVEIPYPIPWHSELAWSGNRVVALSPDVHRASTHGFGWKLFVVEFPTGRVVPIEVGPISRVAWLEGPSETGEILLNLANWGWDANTNGRRFDRDRPWEVYRVDLEQGTLVPDRRHASFGFPVVRAALSPSGRFVSVDSTPSWHGPKRVILRETGEVVEIAATDAAIWLDRDRLVWSESAGKGTRLFVARPGEAPVEIGAWPTEDVDLAPSPDRRRLLVRAEAHAVWDADTAGWTSVPRLLPKPTAETVHWVGPTTLAWRGPDYLVLADLDSLDKRRVVFGEDPLMKGTAAD